MRKEILLFKRVLKELGIYKVYLEDRKRVGVHGILHIKQTLMGDPHPLNSFINCSFCWSDTNHETMWLRLYQTKAAQYTCEEVLMNDAAMTELKYVVKRYIFSG